MESPALLPRRIEPCIAEALLDTPVVLLAGPRQAGKTTLVRHIAAQQGLRYLTLDDGLTLLSAREDPVGMVRSLDRAVIAEIQRAPQLLLAIKKSVDEDRRPGRFLLTGSANLMALPAVAESLAGRMETLSLLPLSQSEIALRQANWIDQAFAGRILQASTPAVGEALVERVLRGGYPEAVARPAGRRRTTWARRSGSTARPRCATAVFLSRCTCCSASTSGRATASAASSRRPNCNFWMPACGPACST